MNVLYIVQNNINDSNDDNDRNNDNNINNNNDNNNDNNNSSSLVVLFRTNDIYTFKNYIFAAEVLHELIEQLLFIMPYKIYISVY